MLIKSYELHIEVSKHSSEEFEYEATALFDVNIKEVMPYLNATLKNGTYLPDVPAFSWRKDDHKIGIWQDKIAADHIDSREKAAELIEYIVQLVNDTWENRDRIEPDSQERDNIQPLQVYALLPKTNCKKCGESSCFSFALKTAAGQVDYKQCDPLMTEESLAEKRNELEKMIAEKKTLL